MAAAPHHDELRADGHRDLLRRRGPQVETDGSPNALEELWDDPGRLEALHGAPNLGSAADHPQVLEILVDNRFEDALIELVPAGHDDQVVGRAVLEAKEEIGERLVGDLVRLGEALLVGPLGALVHHHHPVCRL